MQKEQRYRVYHYAKYTSPPRSLPKLWTYSESDKTTWLYKDCEITGKSDKVPKKVMWVVNPHFKFRRLVPSINWMEVDDNYDSKKRTLVPAGQ